jgi:eukaryotic-like serine/threonine-protein kinase
VARELDGEQRVQFMDEQCRDDPTLRQEVLQLLQQESKTGPLDSQLTVSKLSVPTVVAGRFRIVRYIAEGGMGTVYEAEDLQLHERVALKTIRPDVARDAKAIGRFKREIQLGKSITHPNVCRIHDLVVDRSQTGAEVFFLSMQFLAGETLALRIKQGPISQSEALPLIEDMADGLSAAHRAGVVHRDFKSGNVMLVEQHGRMQAIITDFGLARDIRREPTHTLSQFAGTPDYMAPEQIRGEQLTPAADVYAFGVVMYEMVTGERPFITDSKGTVAQKHLNDAPKPPRDLAPHLDPNWNEAILGCLKKVPSERFPSATEVKAALVQNGTTRITRHVFSRRRIKPVLLAAVVLLLLAATVGLWLYQRWTALPEQKHIAVLPFQNIGNDSADQAFSEGVVESLTSKLSQLERFQRYFWVVPSMDARQIRSLDDAYRKLNVTLAVTGSIQHTDRGVILTANLLDPKNHRQLASRTIHAPADDLDSLQERIWESVADMVDLQVGPQIAQELAEGGTKQPGAYELYEQGLGYAHRYDVDSYERAIALFNEALIKDPHYALAYAGLGNVYASKYAVTKDRQWIEKAKDNAQRALELNDRLVPVHVTLGRLYQETGELDKALAEFNQALDQDPTLLEATYHVGELYEAQGKLARAEEAFRSLLDRRPGYWPGYSGLGAFYYRHGEFQKAARQFQTMIELQPDNSVGYHDLGGVYIAMGRYDDAIKVLEQGLAIKKTSRAYTNLGAAYMYLKRYPEAAEAMKWATDLDPQNDVLWRNLGDSYRQIPSRAAEASAAYNRALQAAMEELKVNPNDSEVLAGIALYHAHLGQTQDAEAFISRALKVNPHDGDILFTAALTYEIIGHRDSAITAIEQAVKAGYSIRDVEEEPELRGLRSDARYQRWLRNVSERRSLSPT